MSFFSLDNFIAGWGAGICGLLIGYAADTIKVQQQVQNNCSPRKIFMSIIRHEGIPGLFKGMLFPLLATGTLYSIYFGVYANTLSVLQNMQNANKEIKTCYDSDVNKYWHHNVFIAGAVGGIAQFFASCPVDIIKTKLQAQNCYSVESNTKRIFLRECIVDLYRHGGWRGFYRGGLVMLFRDIPSNGLYVLAYEHLLSKCRASRGAPSYTISCQMVAGGLAGSLAFAATLPLDVVKSRMQADSVKNPTYNGVVDCVSKSYKRDGFKIFFRGFWMASIVAFPVNAATFAGYEWILKFLTKLRERK